MKSSSQVTMGAAARAVLGPGAGLGRAGAGEAQLGSLLKRAQQVRDIQMTAEEETRLGEAVSERIRQRYGFEHEDPQVGGVLGDGKLPATGRCRVSRPAGDGQTGYRSSARGLQLIKQ